MDLSEETVKQIFFYCDEKRPNPLYADEVDVQIVGNMNQEVANSLNNQRPKF